MTTQQKRNIAIATGLGLIVLQRKRLRQGNDGGGSHQSNLQGAFASTAAFTYMSSFSLKTIFRFQLPCIPFHAAARRCRQLIMDHVPLTRLSADELSQFVRDLRPEVAFTLFHDAGPVSGAAPELEVSAQLDLAEPFQVGWMLVPPICSLGSSQLTENWP